MGRVIWHITMSLDGFIAGPADSMDWAFEGSGPSRLGEEVRDGTGAILAGRRWYDVATEHYDGVAGIYGGKWDGPVFVLTHREAPDDATVTFLRDGLEEALATARAAAGSKDIGIFGAAMAEQCLDAGLLDEIVIHVAPVLLGEGVRLYGPGAQKVRLERMTLEEAGHTVGLRYRVKR